MAAVDIVQMVLLGLIAIIALFFIVVLGLITNLSFDYNRAALYGEFLQKSCGNEYMEAETGRYQFYQAFTGDLKDRTNDVLKLLITSAVLAIAGLVAFFVSCLMNTTGAWDNIKGLFTVNTVKKDDGTTDWPRTSGLVVFLVFFVGLFALLWGLVGRLAEFMGTRDYNDPPTIAAAESAWTRAKQDFITLLVFGILFSAAAAAGFYFYDNNVFDQFGMIGFVGLFVLLYLIVMLILLFILRDRGFLLGHSNEYKAHGEAINAKIREIGGWATDSSASSAKKAVGAQLVNFLKTQKARRTTAETDELRVSDADAFIYLFHQRGEELAELVRFAEDSGATETEIAAVRAAVETIREHLRGIRRSELIPRAKNAVQTMWIVGGLFIFAALFAIGHGFYHYSDASKVVLIGGTLLLLLAGSTYGWFSGQLAA